MHSIPGLQTSLAGRYTIDREVGAGGMAHVYLAHDVRHERKVALKVLRRELAAVIGAQRFLAEIRTTANLQHPHILPLYDSGEADGTVFYVMPFIDGESLRERLNREKQLPVSDAIRIASEVADALDYAHRHNVVHRDIKPENILLHDGRALIADFGIALAVSRIDGASRMTETGMSLGTPHYMSPEQAMGERDITARSDVYALGCVLYEMLTGEPPFTGPTAQAIVARVVTESPRSIVAQRRTVPLHVEAAVHRALEKLPADRFESAAAFASGLQITGPVAYTTSASSVAARNGLPLMTLAAALLVTGIIAAWGWFRPDAPLSVNRYLLQLAPDKFADGMMQLSAAADVFVYGGPNATADRPQELFVKHRDRLEPALIPGTQHFRTFALSPDGKSVAFVLSEAENIGPIRRQSVDGGTPITIVDSASAFSVAWLASDDIVFTRAGAGGPELWRIPAVGGRATKLWSPDSTGALALPSGGPDGQVFVVRHSTANQQALWVVDIDNGNAKKVLDGALYGKWAASGMVVYGTANGALFTSRYDARKRELVGEPVRVLENVEVWYGVAPMFALSESGTLIARQGPSSSGTHFHPVWIDRSGRESAIDSTWSFNPFTLSSNVGWSLSPDGNHLAVGAFENQSSSIWIKPLGAGAPSRLSFEGSDDARPRWSPDGRSVLFVSSRNGGKFALYRKNVNGTGGETLVASSPQHVIEGMWSKDMQWLIARVGDGTTDSRDIHVRRIGVDSALRPLIASPAVDESAPALSADTKWIAYQSNETGTMEIFVRPFPGVNDGRWQVSRGGGLAPLWNPQGGELFYLSPRGDVMSVSVGNGESPDASTPRRLFTLSDDLYYRDVLAYYTPHDVSADGNRFVFLKRAMVANGERSVVVMENLLAK